LIPLRTLLLVAPGHLDLLVAELNNGVIIHISNRLASRGKVLVGTLVVHVRVEVVVDARFSRCREAVLRLVVAVSKVLFQSVITLQLLMIILRGGGMTG
jgi:hypothetical protein